MTDDLVKRIREWDEGCGEWELLEASADRIEKLEAATCKELLQVRTEGERQVRRIEKLEAALREIASIDSYYVSDIVDFARKALEGKDDAD